MCMRPKAPPGFRSQNAEKKKKKPEYERNLHRQNDKDTNLVCEIFIP